jgi:RND family efflux transporter MFP subunit
MRPEISSLPTRNGRGIEPALNERGEASMPIAPSCILHAGVVASALLLAACEQQNRYVPPPPPRVTVATPAQQKVTRYLEATGYTAAVNSANLVARVQGFLQEVKYRDGDLVKPGTVLFVIEPEPYRIKLEQAQAAEAAAEATLKQAEADYKRQVDLVSRQAASQATLDTSTANRDSAQAKLKQAQGDTRQAALNLDYTEVKAPFDGRVSARQVSIGELVGTGSPTQLATIVQSNPIYVNFTVSEQDVLRIREEIRRLGLTPEDLKKVPVDVGLQTDNGYPHRGTLDYAAPTVSSSTGTLAVRAILQNPDNVLLPGYFVRVRLPEAQQQQDVLLVPDAAVGTDLSGRYVLAVNQDNVVEQRKVVPGTTVGELRIIESGLKADDRVIVAGLLRAVPGQKVDPQLQAAAASGAASAK